MSNKTNIEQAWRQILASLAGQMTDATFKQLLAPSVAISFEQGLLTVGVRRPYARAWLQKRLYPVVERAVHAELGDHVKIDFVQLPADGEKKDDAHQVEIVGVYQESRDDIIQPHKHSLVTDYFRRQWIPLLGPTLGWTIIAMRRRAYRNYKTGETRDGFKCTLPELARESGVEHWRTISRALKKPCAECKRLYGKSHPVARHFILEQQWVYQDSKRFGHRIRTGTRFRILLDDPLTPTDQKRLDETR